MEKRRSFFVITGIAAALSGMGAARAEEALGDVVVTASRIEQRSLEAPTNMTVIRSDRLEASGAVSVGDALNRNAPGFAGYHDFGVPSHSPTFTLRGMSDGRVKVLLDGVSLMDGYNSGMSNMIGLTLSDIERIEVAPGVASTLYGSDAVGGVINVISKVPDKREISARYLRGFNDLKRDEYEASYRDRWDNGLAASVSVRYIDFAGYNDSPITVAPLSAGTGTPATGARPTTTDVGAKRYIIGDRGVTSATALYLNNKLYYNLDAKSKFFAGFRYIKTEKDYSTFRSYLRDANGNVINPPTTGTTNVITPQGDRLGLGKTTLWNTSAPAEREEKHYSVGYDGKAWNDTDLKVTLNHSDIVNWTASTPGTTALTNFDGGSGRQTYSPNKTLEGMAQLGKKLHNQHYFLVGVSSSQSKMRGATYEVSDWRHPEGSKTGTLDEMKGKSTLNAVYAQDQYAVNRMLTLYLGARFDRWETHGVTERNVAPQGVFERNRRTVSALSPKISAVYRINDTLTLRSSVGSAFHAPSNYELYANYRPMGTLLLVADPNLKPEKARSLDVGVEKALPGGGVIKAGAYHTRMKDMIYRKRTLLTPAEQALYGANYLNFSMATNAARAKVQGIELSGEIPVTRWLRAQAGYAYTDAKFTQDDSGQDLVGKRVPYVPRQTFTLGLDAKWQDWRAYFSAQYIGERYANATNDDKEKYVPGALSDRFWLAHLRVSRTLSPKVQAALIIHNLFDKTHYTVNDIAPGRSAALQFQASF